MKWLVRLVITLAVCVGSLKVSVFDRDFDGPIEDHAKYLADFFDQRAPYEYDGITHYDAEADGRVLILRSEGDFGENIKTDEATMTRLMRPLVCNDKPRKFVEAGGVLRIEARDRLTHYELPAAKVAYCGET